MILLMIYLAAAAIRVMIAVAVVLVVVVVRTVVAVAVALAAGTAALAAHLQERSRRREIAAVVHEGKVAEFQAKLKVMDLRAARVKGLDTAPVKPVKPVAPRKHGRWCACEACYQLPIWKGR